MGWNLLEVNLSVESASLFVNLGNQWWIASLVRGEGDGLDCGAAVCENDDVVSEIGDVYEGLMDSG